MSKIIVGVDLSPASERAVAHGLAAARHAGDEVVLAMADLVPDPASTLPPEVRGLGEGYTRLLAGRLEAHRQALAALRTRWVGQGAEISTVVADGRPDERLPAIAHDAHADLIVVGSHGRTGVKRLFLGSVAERVVRHADQSVLVARGEAPIGGYRRVVIGTDFSAHAVQAARRACAFLAGDASVVLVHAWEVAWSGVAEAPPLVPPLGDMQGILDRQLADAAAQLRTELRDRPAVTVTTSLSTTAPVQALTEACVAHKADLLVVGSHGHRGLRRFFLGSVAELAVRHAPCAVLVARPPSRTPRR